MKSVNPFSGSVIEVFTELSDTETDRIIDQSGSAFYKWKRSGFPLRKEMMLKVSADLTENRREYASAITSEMGKPITESLAEIDKCVWVCSYYAEKAEEFLKTEFVSSDADESYISYEPLGVILAVMPWNFPFWQVFRFAVPTLMAGNTALLKHSSNVQICARHIENIFKRAGFDNGIFSNLVIGSSKVRRVLENPQVMAVSLTGSEFAGQQVAMTAAGKIKKSLLELGGSNAFIVLEDADLRKAASVGMKARMQNGGQSCIAAKRFIVHEKISSEFIALFREEMKSLHYGDPLLETTTIGPLSSVAQAEEVEKQLNRSLEMGASLVTGGKRHGAFFEPTLVTGVKPGMPLFDEEVFGPVTPVTIARDANEALSLSNLSEFGLGVTVFTSNIQKAKDLSSEFNEGAVFINSLVKSDPRLPFGGVKRSGYGRELGMHGIREFVNVKTVVVKL